MGVSDEVQQIAKSLDAMLAAAEDHAADETPVSGGDYDTIGGWQERLGVSGHQMKKLIRWAESEGLATCGVRGRVRRARGWYTVDLIHCPHFAGVASE